MKMVLVGAGQRGRIYANYIVEKGYAEFAAVAEPDEFRRFSAAEYLGIARGGCFATAEKMWSQGKIADAAIIASMDKDHYRQVMDALDLGYDIILEKPISPNPRECLSIANKASKLGRRVLVCHVLRYTPFFTRLKTILDSGELGRVMNICLNENVGNFHIAHSFVRGNWRNSASTSPIIMQKSCHDMDLLTWLANSPAKKIASYGSLRHFIPDNAPTGSGLRCCDCSCEPDCRFSAYKCYLPVMGDWPAVLVTPEHTEEAMQKALETSPYGRCVYRCDNDVCDSQIVAVLFENDITASFCMSGFTNRMNRSITVMCEDGEIEGDDGLNTMKVTRFCSNQVEGYNECVIHTSIPTGGHGGGDVTLVDDFFAPAGSAKDRTSVQQSVESHLMACAAEESRLSGVSVEMADYRKKLNDMPDTP